MTRYLVRRLLAMIPTLVGISVLVFFLVHLIPGDPALVLLGQDASPEELARLRRVMGLDRPLPVQLARYLGRVAMGDLGQSLTSSVPVLQLVLAHAPATVELAVGALVVTVVLSLPLGIVAAVRQNSVLDLAAGTFAQLGVSIPVFWSGIMLMMLFSLELRWLPSVGEGTGVDEAVAGLLRGDTGGLADNLRHLALPALSLGLYGAALTTRMVRSAMLEVLSREYLRTARAKGLAERVVIYKHALRNALLPVITIVGLQFGNLLGGAVITETIFAWPGVGRLSVEAIGQRDFPVVQGTVLLVAAGISLVNVVVDLSYAWIDPRIRYD